MADAPVPDTERSDFLRGVASSLKNVRRKLGYPQDAGGRSVGDPTVPRERYMTVLRAQLRLDEAGDRPPDPDDPFGSYLHDVAAEIERGADRVRERLRTETSAGVTGEVVCCIVNGLFRILSSQNLAEETDRVREVAEEDVRKWVRLLRELLLAFRETLSGGAMSGKLSFDITLLEKDITAILLEGLEAGLVAILFAVHEMLADAARDVDEDVTDAIAETRCPPLLRIWTSIYDFIFGGASGLIGRTRTMLRDVLTRQARKRRSALTEVSLGAEVDADKRERWTRVVNDLIEILDAILAALSVFSICRVPTEEAAEEEREQQEEPSPDAPTGPPREGPDRSSPSGPDRPSREPRASGTRGAASFTRQEDPDLGTVSVLRGSEKTDSLYLTPTNAAKLMTTAFDVDPARAREITETQSCRDELSTETESVLQDLNIIE